MSKQVENCIERFPEGTLPKDVIYRARYFDLTKQEGFRGPEFDTAIESICRGANTQAKGQTYYEGKWLVVGTEDKQMLVFVAESVIFPRAYRALRNYGELWAAGHFSITLNYHSDGDRTRRQFFGYAPELNMIIEPYSSEDFKKNKLTKILEPWAKVVPTEPARIALR